MNYFDEFDFKTSTQLRAKKALSDIVSSIEILSQSEDLENLKIRDLTARSGYSLGAIFHYFNSFNDIFIYVFLVRRKQAILKAVKIINEHPSDEPLSVLGGNLLDSFMYELSRPNRKTLLFVMGKFFKHSDNPQLINMELDVTIPAWMNASQRDKTNTFSNFSENELRLRLRSIQSFVRSPFLENNDIAGTEEHKAIALDIFMRLFTNQR